MVECESIVFHCLTADDSEYPKSQIHAKVYPTLAKIALDVLPAQASSVPCEQLFSGGKEIAVTRRAQLGADLFEQLQMLKFA